MYAKLPNDVKNIVSDLTSSPPLELKLEIQSENESEYLFSVIFRYGCFCIHMNRIKEFSVCARRGPIKYIYVSNSRSIEYHLSNKTLNITIGSGAADTSIKVKLDCHQMIEEVERFFEVYYDSFKNLLEKRSKENELGDQW